MSLLTFAVAEAIGLFGLYLTWRGVFGLGFAGLVVIVMLGLSFHVMARQPRADGTSIRMACFASMLWYGALLSGKLFLEFRSWIVSLLALVFLLVFGVIAGFATWSVIERPLDYDVDEAE